MQDYTRNLKPSAKVGFTTMDEWLIYAPLKNSAPSAAKVPECSSPASSEMAIYKANCLILQNVGAYVEGGMEIDFGHAQKVQMWPRIVWHPGWALTSSDVLKKMLYEKERSSITLASSLVLSAPDIVIENLQLDGTLFVHTVPGVIVTLRNLRVKNEGWRYVWVDDHKEEDDSKAAKVRNYKIENVGETNLLFDKAGPCCVENIKFDSSLTSCKLRNLKLQTSD